MRSSRLPGKVMLPILGRSMLELMIERLRRVPKIDEIVVATTVDQSCQPIMDLAASLGVGCFRGSEDDVLERVLQAARFAHGDVIVETTGDCPLIDPEVINQVITAYNSSGVDYCSNILQRTYPRGMDVQVFSVDTLAKVAELTDDPTDHEHVSLYIYEHPELFRLLNVRNSLPTESSRFRLTVDTAEDFELTRRIYERLYPANPKFGLNDITYLLEHEPELSAINAWIDQQPVQRAQ